MRTRTLSILTGGTLLLGCLMIWPKGADAARAGWEKIGSATNPTGAPFWCGSGPDGQAPGAYYQGDNNNGQHLYRWSTATGWTAQGTAQFVYNVTTNGAYDPFGPVGSRPWDLHRGDATLLAHYTAKPLPSAAAWTYSELRDTPAAPITERFTLLDPGQVYDKFTLAPSSEIPKLQITDGSILGVNGEAFVDARTGSNQFRAVVVDANPANGKRIRYRRQVVEAKVAISALGSGVAPALSNGPELEQIVVWAGYNTSFDLYAASLRFEKVGSDEFVPHAIIKRKICGHYDSGSLVRLSHLAPWTPGKRYHLLLTLNENQLAFTVSELDAQGNDLNLGVPVTRSLASLGTAEYAKDTGGNYLTAGTLLPGTGGIRADRAEFTLAELTLR